MKKRIWAWAFAVAMLGGCLTVQAQEVTKDTSQTENVTSTADEQIHKAASTEVTFKKIGGELKDGRKGALLVRVKGNIPVLSNTDKNEAATKINAYYTSKAEALNEDKEAAYKVAKQVYDDEIYKSNEDAPYSWKGYKLGMKYTLAYQNDKVISFVEEDTKTAGTDAEDLVRQTQNFDMATGEMIELKDIVTNEDKAKEYIHNYIVDEIKDAIDDDKGYLYDGYKDHIDEMLAGSSWRFSDTGIVIIANEYSFTPQATGYKEFSIPFSHFPYLKDAYKK